MSNKSAKLKKKNLSLFVFFFTLAIEGIFIRTHGFKNRCYMTGKYILFACASAYHSARKHYRLGTEGVNLDRLRSLWTESVFNPDCLSLWGCFTGICIISMVLSCTYVHVCVLFYWYLLCSRKANFYVIHRQ